jgi:hypothetical protein
MQPTRGTGCSECARYRIVLGWLNAPDKARRIGMFLPWAVPSLVALSRDDSIWVDGWTEDLRVGNDL